MTVSNDNSGNLSRHLPAHIIALCIAKGNSQLEFKLSNHPTKKSFDHLMYLIVKMKVDIIDIEQSVKFFLSNADVQAVNQYKDVTQLGPLNQMSCRYIKPFQEEMRENVQLLIHKIKIKWCHQGQKWLCPVSRNVRCNKCLSDIDISYFKTKCKDTLTIECCSFTDGLT